VNIPSFLHLYPPFDDLSEERLDEVVRHTHIEFYPEGRVIIQQGGEPTSFLHVIRTGAVEFLDGTQVADVYYEGEVFGFVSLLTSLAPAFTVRAQEETICYLVDSDIAREVMSTRHGLSFLATGLRRREVSALRGLERESSDPWLTKVGSLIRRAPVTVPASSSIREAAGLMTSERISSVLVEAVDRIGILTDRDLRSRVLAPGRSAETSVVEVLSSPLITVPHDAGVAEVISLMLERGIHHVPVVDDAGELLGVVTDTDLIGLEQKTPFVLKSDIERAADAGEAVETAKRLPEVVTALMSANVDPLDVGHAIAVTVDTLTQRLLEHGIRKLGDPPCPWAWIALGSEARQEQGLATDQDNALVLRPKETAHEELDQYFDRLATFVNDHLEEAGFPKCRAGVIASNPEWRDTDLGWEQRFRGWVEDPGRTGSAFTGIAFDYRPVAGPLEIRPLLDGVIRGARAERTFVRHLAKLAVDARPPTGLLKDAVLDWKGKSAEKLDVKHGGIAPITNLARVFAIMAGLTENRTLRRLREVATAGTITEDVRLGLEESFRLLWQIRLEHQVECVRVDVPPDDLVDPRSLGPLTRQGLKEAFRMIERVQDSLASELGLRR
jgi:CBS domain-containing protein